MDGHTTRKKIADIAQAVVSEKSDVETQDKRLNMSGKEKQGDHPCEHHILKVTALSAKLFGIGGANEHS